MTMSPSEKQTFPEFVATHEGLALATADAFDGAGRPVLRVGSASIDAHDERLHTTFRYPCAAHYGTLVRSMRARISRLSHGSRRRPERPECAGYRRGIEATRSAVAAEGATPRTIDS